MKIKPCCECCGGQSHIKVANKRNYDLYRCESCGLVFVWPQLSTDELQKIYDTSDGYYSANVDNLSMTSTRRADDLDRLLKAAGLESGRLLDVGCATGALIYHLRNIGWDVCGIEVNPGAVAIAQNHSLDVVLCRIQDNPYEEGSFNVIHMGDVIEHVDSPAHILDISHFLLKANGVLVLRTPNADCSFAKLTLPLSKYLGLPWPHSEAPYHLFDFSPNSLSQLLILHGFQIVSIGYESTSRFTYIIGGMGYFDGLKRNIKKRRHSIYSLATIRHAPILAILTILLFPLFLVSKAIDRLRRTGNVMNIVAKRSSHIKITMTTTQDDKRI